MKNKKSNKYIQDNKKNPLIKNDPRKHPRPGYDEKNPTKKEDIQDHPEDQNTG